VTIRAALVDDEPTARQRLRRLLAARHPDVVVVVEADSGVGAIALLEQEPVDLLFLDIRLPGGDGFQVLEAVARSGRSPAVVFVTAFDSYAVRAFEVNAVDYLLKPIEADRLEDAMTRVRLTRSRSDADPEFLLSLVDRLARSRAAAEDPGRRHADRLLIRKDGRQWFVPVEEIESIESARNYVRVSTARGERHLVRSTLGQIEAALDPGRFIRVHRTAIVNAARIKHLEPWFSGDMIIVMESGAKVKLSRVYRAAFYAALGTPG